MPSLKDLVHEAPESSSGRSVPYTKNPMAMPGSEVARPLRTGTRTGGEAEGAASDQALESPDLALLVGSHGL